MKLFPNFQSISTCLPNRGKSDVWIDQVVKDMLPPTLIFHEEAQMLHKILS